MSYPPLIKKLIEKFQVLPSVGPKTAEQYAFALKKLSPREIGELADAIKDLTKLSQCELCQALTDKGKFCDICKDPKRDKTVLMALESEPDLESIEKTARYQGLYFVLGEIEEKGIRKLIERIKRANPQVKELVLAFDVTPQMELSLFEIKQALRTSLRENLSAGAVKKAGFADLKISRLGRGLPTGGDLRYADTQTLLGALQHRENV